MSDNHSVLLPPQITTGGLIKMPKKNPSADEHEFKAPLPIDSKPKGSLLGLDKLAAAKKKERLENQAYESNSQEPSSKRSKVYSYKDGEMDDEETPHFRANFEKDSYDLKKYKFNFTIYNF
jgi:hypothetical protein